LSIRSNANGKDQLRGREPAFALVEASPPQQSADPLRFRTSHPSKAVSVDLGVFQTGQQQVRATGMLWNGPFRGRPELIAEMAPAIQDHLAPLAEKSVSQYLIALRTWWRLLDALELVIPDEAALTSTAQLTELHRQRAFDQGMDRLTFGNFLLLTNLTRSGLGLKPLYWQRPEPRKVKRHLPPQWQTDLVRRELKHRWFAALDRWALASELVRSGAPLISREEGPAIFSEQERLLRNYLRFEEIVVSTGHPRPSAKQLTGDQSTRQFYDDGNTTMDMMLGRYPDGDDIRAALHLCLATTGWNPAVLLSLNVDEPFIEPHPKDSSRYVLRGIKERGARSEQVSEGLFKTQGGAAAVLQTLIRQTDPLRQQLRREHLLLSKQHASEVLTTDERQALEQRMTSLEQGLRSPWLFVSHVGDGIHWLDDKNFSGSTLKRKSYLGDVVEQLNVRQPTERQLSPLKPTDFRDAYAAHVYHANGGSILAVMKALGHRRLSSTKVYLDNTLLREEHRKLYSTFSAALWGEIAANARVDPAILAKMSRDGDITSEERERLHSYRTLLRSRIGVGCKDPKNPPRHIAPDFVPDGEKTCHVQRCTLCLDHAVIFPESMPGLCKRMAELQHIRETMGVGAFLQSTFAEELDNTELALLAFDAAEVSRQVLDWTSRIESGTHRVPVFDGQQGGVQL
jgi:hypothetical protein